MASQIGSGSRVGVAAVLVGLASAPASGATIEGTVIDASVVWIAASKPAAPSAREMRNLAKAFVPDLLVISVGSTVRFPNDDPFFHSIYSASDADPFDIGFYETGPGKEVAFTRPGVLEVRCHIHPLMHATIVVVDGPYVSAAGRFSLADVEAGDRTVNVWSAASGLRSLVVRVPNRDSLVKLVAPV